MTGCQFAKLIAQDKDRLIRVTFPEFASGSDVTGVFELGAMARLPAIAIFTGIRTEAALAKQLTILAAGQSMEGHRGAPRRACDRRYSDRDRVED